MILIRDWNDLRAHGIVFLTGESCALSMRILCDVTASGHRLFCKVFGLDPAKNPLGEAWNRGHDDDLHVGSVLLSRGVLETIAIFAALEAPGVKICYNDYDKDGNWVGVYGMNEEELDQEQEWVKAMREFGHRVRRYSYLGAAGDRNRHQMSGRVD